jgi:CheY-like chemotaxis protein
LLNILIIEDNGDDVELLVRGLRRVGFTGKIGVQRDGAEAVAYLENLKTKPRPDLILLDLTLPKKSGLEVLRWLKQHEELSRIPVFVLSSSPFEKSIKEAYQLGAKTFFLKPLDERQILALAGASTQETKSPQTA